MNFDQLILDRAYALERLHRNPPDRTAAEDLHRINAAIMFMLDYLMAPVAPKMASYQCNELGEPIRVLQSYRNGIGRYVPLDKWNAAEFAYEPLAASEIYKKEQATMASMLELIVDMEAKGLTPTEVTEDVESIYDLFKKPSEA